MGEKRYSLEDIEAARGARWRRAEFRDWRMLYPMYVVDVADFLQMRAVRPHQALRSEGMSKQHSNSSGQIAVFVSHQWSGQSHPDPNFSQLGVLQAAFRGAAAGTLRIDADFLSLTMFGMKARVKEDDMRGVKSWCMWYDYFSVPQPEAHGAPAEARDGLLEDLRNAIASLSFYVASCQHFMVLAPTMAHENGHNLDYLSWKTRGWCRFERLARVLRCEDARILFVRRGDCVTEMGVQDFIFEPVGMGEFSAEEDRGHLAATVRHLFEDKLSYYLAAERMQEYRFLMALRSPLLEGLPLAPSDGRTSRSGSLVRHSVQGLVHESFAEQLFWGCPANQELHGTMLLLLASRASDLQAMQGLISARARLDCAERHAVAEFAIGRGQTPIHAAAWHGHRAAVSLLLRARASASAQNRVSRSTPLHNAGSTGKPSVLQLLLSQRAHPDARSSFGQTPLEVCICYSRAEGVQALLEAGASVATSAEGLSPLHEVALFGSGPELAARLLEARAALEAHYQPRRGKPVWIVLSALTLSRRFGSKSPLRSIAYHGWKATPLMLAVMTDRRAEARVMLDAGADADALNRWGESARSLARLFGTMGGAELSVHSVPPALLRAAADTRGASPRPEILM